MIKGSNAGERKGVVYTIGSIDHPLVLLSKSSFRLGLGDVDIVGLKVEQVKDESYFMISFSVMIFV